MVHTFAGFCDPAGNLTNWLNELAFVPVDYRPDGPLDEWSGDEGCGVQYFSQQGACRLLPAVGIHLPADMKFPEQLVELQTLMANGDPRAVKVQSRAAWCLRVRMICSKFALLIGKWLLP
jgi:hypothetical protein